MKLTIEEDFHRGTCYLFRFLITKSHYLKRNMSLTLRAPRVLVPTPSTKGGGGSKRTPPVSQEREMLQT